LILLPACQNLPPPHNLDQLPTLAQLNSDLRTLVPNIVLPHLALNSPIIRQVDSEILTTETNHLVKRPADVFEETSSAKKGKIVFY
jgi:hypothetical protein